MSKDPIVILSAKRTPIGALGGELSQLTAAELGAIASKAAIKSSGVSSTDIDEVVFGNVLGAGQGQAPARQVALGAGMSEQSVCTTINKMCGSGMKATMFAHDLIKAGSADVMLCGGTESMSNAPYLLPKMREGLRMGHSQVQDHMFIDGLEDAYDSGCLMGVFAEQTVSEYQFSREAQDKFALSSLERSLAAQTQEWFKNEMVEVEVHAKKETTKINSDEQPRNAMPEKIPNLRPAFAKDGTVTAANASSISDGAAALILSRASVAEKLGLTPMAKIVAHASNGVTPAKFPIAPIDAVNKLFAKTNTTVKDYGLFEVNEAFAVVAMASMHSLHIPHENLNVNGGACALGHPIGASGARILVTLLHAMQRNTVKNGLASICIGGGEATAMALELMS